MADIGVDTNNDVTFSNGNMEIKTGSAQTLQAVRLQLETWKGEWKFDIDQGTDWKTILRTVPPNNPFAEREIRRSVLSVRIYPNNQNTPVYPVKTVLRVDMSFNNTTQALTAFVKYLDIYSTQTQEISVTVP